MSSSSDLLGAAQGLDTPQPPRQVRRTTLLGLTSRRRTSTRSERLRDTFGPPSRLWVSPRTTGRTRARMRLHRNAKLGSTGRYALRNSNGGEDPRRARRQARCWMRLLVLGGTVFLGRHLVEAALERGHKVTVFTRGRHNPQLFPDAEKLHGDRGRDLASLRGRRWDVAID